MGTARQAVIHPGAFKAPSVSLESAGAPIASSESEQVIPATLNPYRAARARSNARIRARLLAASRSETDTLRTAFEDLILLMNRVSVAGANVEADPLAWYRDAESPPSETVLPDKPDGKPAALSVIEWDRSPSPGIVEAASPPAIEEPAYIDAEPGARSVRDPKKRENVASALVSFHRDMQVPRVAPFIIDPGKTTSDQSPSSASED